MDFGLSSKVALVAGASSGLGFATAKALALEGAHVAICSRNEDKLAKAKAELAALASGDVDARRVDLEDMDQIAQWIEQVTSRFGAVDVLVTNNGGPPTGPTSQFRPDAYQTAVARCMLPAVQMINTTLPIMARAPYGRILMITSEVVLKPVKHFSLSSISRAGLVAYAKVLVQEIGARPITVNVLAPGYHATETLQNIMANDADGAIQNAQLKIPAGRIGDPEDFGAVAAFLASGRASFVTGNVIAVDGGMSCAG